MKGQNELYLLTILNESFPGKWVSEYQGLNSTAINKKGIEYRRKFRFDCACPSLKVAIEIEGAIWTQGRHNRPIGMQQDMDKYNLATLEGWRLLRYTPEQLMKQPNKIIDDVRKLCGDERQTKLNDLSSKQVKL